MSSIKVLKIRKLELKLIIFYIIYLLLNENVIAIPPRYTIEEQINERD